VIVKAPVSTLPSIVYTGIFGVLGLTVGMAAVVVVVASVGIVGMGVVVGLLVVVVVVTVVVVLIGRWPEGICIIESASKCLRMVVMLSYGH
jgi:hypothetical protein